jgi:hypothetical protein
MTNTDNDQPVIPADSSAHEWDAFISHASEDKAFVLELVTTLSRLGLRVWYDDFELKPGDSLVASLDKGLARSRFGILVLSPAFIGKPWPEYERRGLTSRDVAEGTVLVPIWRNVTRADVARLSPTLADKLAVNATATSTLETALRLLSVLNPDRFDSMSRRAALDAILRAKEPELVSLSDINMDLDAAPARHETLPPELVGRIRVIYQVFADVHPSDWDRTVREFKADFRPDNEVAIWEGMAAVYLQLIREHGLDRPGREELFEALLLASNGQLDELDNRDLIWITPNAIRVAYSELEEIRATIST